MQILFILSEIVVYVSRSKLVFDLRNHERKELVPILIFSEKSIYQTNQILRNLT